MKRLQRWLAYTILALGYAQGLQGAGIATTPSLDPAAVAHQWEQRRILDIDEEGYAVQGDQHLNAAEQARLYRRSGARQAQSLYRESRQVRGSGVVKLLLAPAIGAGLGGVGGSLWSQETAGGSMVNGAPLEQWTAAGGALLGLGVGALLKAGSSRNAADLQAQAAESYNRTVLQNLKVWVQPARGGAQLRVGTNF